MNKCISEFAHFIGYEQDNSFYVQNGNVSYRQFYFEGRRQFKIQGLIGTRYHKYYRSFKAWS